MRSIEMRAATIPLDAEVRAEPGGPRRIVWTASVFDRPAEFDGWSEVVRPGAFARAIAEGQDVRALVEHDPARIFGRTLNGTLSLREDARGLVAEATLPPTTLADDLAALVEGGYLAHGSFAFRARSERWTRGPDGPRRELLDVDLYDVALVAYPAYPDAAGAAAIRARGLARLENPDLPARLRAARVRLAAARLADAVKMERNHHHA